MKKSIVIILLLILPLSNYVSAYAESPNPGDSCQKVNQQKTYKSATFVCVEEGKRLVWSKKLSKLSPQSGLRSDSGKIIEVKIPKSQPTSFDNLYKNRQGIHYAAWKNLNSSIQNAKPHLGSIEINIGPNTKPYFKPMIKSFSAVASLFAKFEQPNRLIVYQYNYTDLQWAVNDLKSKISTEDWARAERQDSQGKLFEGNCDIPSQNCFGSEVVSTNNNLSIMLLGVSNTLNPFDATDKPKRVKGMTEAHEYFHSVQDIPINGNYSLEIPSKAPLEQNLRPPIWLTEGSATWVMNAAINYKDFNSYRDLIQTDCGQDSFCVPLTEERIKNFLSYTNQGEIEIPEYDHYLNYNLGALIVETLVSIKGSDSIMQMYQELGKGLGWEAAFIKVFGVDWNIAYPIMAKTIAANISDYL